MGLNMAVPGDWGQAGAERLGQVIPSHRDASAEMLP